MDDRTGFFNNHPLWQPIISRENSHGHERRVGICPRKRLPFCFEKSVYHNGVAFERCSARLSRGFSIDHCRAGIDGRETRPIGEDHLATIWNTTRINGAMPLLQSRAGGALVLSGEAVGAGSTAGPVNGDSSEDCLLAGESFRRQQEEKSDGGDDFH
jgi:hypothetical protein